MEPAQFEQLRHEARGLAQAMVTAALDAWVTGDDSDEPTAPMDAAYAIAIDRYQQPNGGPETWLAAMWTMATMISGLVVQVASSKDLEPLEVWQEICR